MVGFGIAMTKPSFKGLYHLAWNPAIKVNGNLIEPFVILSAWYWLSVFVS